MVSDWEDSVGEVDEIPPVNGRGERAGMLQLGSTCSEKHHHDESYVCGSHQECTTTYRTESYECGEVCSDNGNGFATCTPSYCTNSVPDGESCQMVDEYCERPIYETWCSYITQTWEISEVQTRSGAGTEGLVWAQPTAGEEDRLRWRARYDVVIPLEEGEEYVFHPGGTTDDDELLLLEVGERDQAAEVYRDWRVGEDILVRRLNIGPVVEVVRADGRVERD